ncbi:MAG: hypothetical protein BKP49_03810 [Treponema sp. CETP13]|nr:MAG: hypothetical protein BKP49_03810 [Treponema sp. CETP13]
MIGKEGKSYSFFYDSPADTINFVCAHDGFTLAYLVSYKGAGNALNSTLDWLFGPSDGGNGDTNSPYTTTETGRRQAVRNFMFFSHIANLRQNEPALTEPDYDVAIDYCKPDGTTAIASTDDSDYLIFSNKDLATCDFTVPALASGKKWVCIVNTDANSEANYNYWDNADATTSYTTASTCSVNTWSIVVLKLIAQ